MAEPVKSTGRGGVGNIGKDGAKDTPAARPPLGTRDSSQRGHVPAGRGGAGNITNATAADISTEPSTQKAPEAIQDTDALSIADGQTKPDDFYCGRGGEGNIHRKAFGGHSAPQSDEGGKPLVTKAKDLLGLNKEKDRTAAKS